MAAPAEVTVKDLTGQWYMNKGLSDDTDPVLSLQGIGWLTRKAIGLASLTLHTKQYADEAGVVHIDINQTATGGVKGTTELRQLDWTFRSHSDWLFGTLEGKSRWLGDLGLVDDDFLKQDWLATDVEQGGPNGEYLIHNYIDNKEKGWVGEQVWGFALIDGKRYHVRRIVITKGDKNVKVRLIYDWQGKK